VATVTIVVRNDGLAAVEDLVLTDEVGHAIQLRGASSEAGTCVVEGSRASCGLGRLASWSEATVRVRVLVDRRPAGHVLANRVSLSAGGHMPAEQQTLTALLEPGPTRQMGLVDLSEHTLTLVVLVSFALAHQRRSPTG
jgi:hypothetical protein